MEIIFNLHFYLEQSSFMQLLKPLFSITFIILLFIGCKNAQKSNIALNATALQPAIVTDTVFEDSDDPAIWINAINPAESLILGTDKHDNNGGIYIFDLKGKIDRNRTKIGLSRINNIDIAYGLSTSKGKIDIAVATERGKNTIRIVSLPNVDFIDNGGIPVFEGEKEKSPMGVALYKNPTTQIIYAIVGRKSGPAEGYLYQYLLKENGNGIVIGELVRKFGKYSGKKEIESIAVDNELGYIYYSDEQVGIRKYYADPSKGNEELAIFGQNEFKEDNEGISIYKFSDGTGYILVSDQSANKFNIYPREGSKGQPNNHQRIASVDVSTDQSDGSDVTSTSLPGFKGGLFVAMSTNKTFHYYRWSDIAKKAGLKTRK
jgi:3-phytase